MSSSTYISTRGESKKAGFPEVLLRGLAPDGGLYLPVSWPQLPKTISPQMNYDELALVVLQLFTGDAYRVDELSHMIEKAYSVFSHPDRCPMLSSGENEWLMQLHHGPTLAFKDIAMRLLAQMIEYELGKSGARATVLGATSGDTGAAAIDAFRGSSAVDVFILYPHGRVSDIQRRQMTMPEEENVHALAVQGDFDDCQALVKAAFADDSFRKSVSLSAVNSINWARIIAQTVYYIAACQRLQQQEQIDERGAVFSVPTGNFGDIFAGWVAKKIGANISRLIVATNENDILDRALRTGIYEPRQTVPTISPSMDIQLSSNFERALFEASGRDAVWIRSIFDELKHKGRFSIPGEVLEILRKEYASERVGTEEALASIDMLKREKAIAIDPHSSVALVAAGRSASESDLPHVVLATAHPGKFADAVERATGEPPSLPDQLKRVLAGEERVNMVENSLLSVKKFICEKRRVI